LSFETWEEIVTLKFIATKMPNRGGGPKEKGGCKRGKIQTPSRRTKQGKAKRNYLGLRVEGKIQRKEASSVGKKFQKTLELKKCSPGRPSPDYVGSTR